MNRARVAREKAARLSFSRFSVTNVEGDVPGNSSVEKTKFFKSEMMADIGGSRWRTLDFWYRHERALSPAHIVLRCVVPQSHR